MHILKNILAAIDVLLWSAVSHTNAVDPPSGSRMITQTSTDNSKQENFTRGHNSNKHKELRGGGRILNFTRQSR